MDGETSGHNLAAQHGRKHGRGEHAAPQCAVGQSPVKTFKLSPTRSLKLQNNSWTRRPRRSERGDHPPYAGILEFSRRS